MLIAADCVVFVISKSPPIYTSLATPRPPAVIIEPESVDVDCVVFVISKIEIGSNGETILPSTYIDPSVIIISPVIFTSVGIIMFEVKLPIVIVLTPPVPILSE